MVPDSISHTPLLDQERSEPHFNFGDDKYTAPRSKEFLSTPDLITDCLDHMVQNNIPIGDIIGDGQIHRFSIDAKRGKKDEWYIARTWEFKSRLYLYCYYGSWSSGEQCCYRSWENNELTFQSTEEKSEFDRHLRELEEQAIKAKKFRQDEAAAEALEIWEKASLHPTSPGHNTYTQLKGIKPYGIRFGKNPSGYDSVIIPLTNIDGQLRSLQFISVGKGGTVFKQFLAGGETKGLFYVIGNLRDSGAAYVVEGFSTGASVHEATKKPVIIAFTCRNLLPVIESIQKRLPKCQLTLAADDDVGKRENPGRTCAEEAAEKYFCKVVFPKFRPDLHLPNGDIPSDFNDVLALEGIEEVFRQLESEKASVVSEEVILKALNNNESGDADLFLTMFGEKYIFDHSEGQFYKYNDCYWEVDQKEERYSDLLEVANLYQRLSEKKELEEKEASPEDSSNLLSKNLSKRASSLKTLRRQKNVLEMATKGSQRLSFNGEWDLSPGYLPCANGIVELATAGFLPPRPEQYIKTICPTNYIPDAKCPLFEKFLLEIMLGDAEMVSFLQLFFGLVSLGIPMVHVFAILFGEKGRNGKGVLIRTLSRVLGRFAFTFSPEMVLKQRNAPSSGSPRSDLMHLKGTRLAIFSEINKDRSVDSSVIKNLSGGDPISARHLYSKEVVNFSPTHTLVLQTNFLPKAPTDDHAFWERALIIPFGAHFVENPNEENQRKIDIHMEEKLKKEDPGILNWLIEGAGNYSKYGFKIPEKVLEANSIYKKENDGIERFLNEKCSISGGKKTPCQLMQDQIRSFCKNEGVHIPTPREITRQLGSKFQKTSRSSGNFWVGVQIVE